MFQQHGMASYALGNERHFNMIHMDENLLEIYPSCLENSLPLPSCLLKEASV